MVPLTAVSYLIQVASFLKVQAGKITLNENGIPTRVTSKSKTSGYLNIILQLIKEANSNLGGSNILENAQVRQWIEYAVLYALKNDNSIVNQVLRELNAILATRTYLVAHKLTIADVFLYYILQNTMVNLTLLDKEKYMHLSRWYDNLQQNPSIRLSNQLINFCTLYLANTAPAKL